LPDEYYQILQKQPEEQLADKAQAIVVTGAQNKYPTFSEPETIF
jgi:actin-related protein